MCRLHYGCFCELINTHSVYLCERMARSSQFLSGQLEQLSAELNLHDLCEASDDQLMHIEQRIVLNDQHEWIQELSLELVRRQLFLFKEFDCQLPKRVNSEHCNPQVRMTACLVEMLRHLLPDFGPHNSDPIHVVVRDFDDLNTKCELMRH